MTMKKFILFIAVFHSFMLFSQEKVVKPTYTIIANNEIITKEKLTELGKQGFVKSMSKGVTQEDYKILIKRFGDKIGDKEFIIKIDLFTKQEKAEQQKKISSKDKVKHQNKNPNSELKLRVNDRAKGFTVQMINGEKINLYDLKGKVVLVNYWATWCASCLIELSEFPEKILTPFKDKDFVLIAISIGENKEKVVQKINSMKKYGVDFNVGIDPKKEIWNQYATGAIPKNFLIDRNGIIKYISIGNSEGNVDKLAVEIKKLLVENQ
ncbi:MAG: TlpA family protein disulfide reductase [Flavobacteriaceae bacterium]|nr:TlpA family protein disulfide reductase [Flavobacteriaceae bacterium]